MKSRYVNKALVATVGLSMMACAAEDNTALLADEMTVPDDVEVQPPGVTKVFEDQYSPNGVLRVYESPDGITVMLTGGIGEDSPPQLSSDTGSLAELYRTLHPEVDSVPNDLEELSARLDVDRANAPRREYDGTESEALTVPKSSASFFATACVNFFATSVELYVAADCKYFENVDNSAIMKTAPLVDGFDRVLMWNETSRLSTISLRRPDGFSAPGMAVVQQAPFTWGHASWPGSFSGYHGKAHIQIGGAGNFGLTVHDRTFVIR